MEKNEIIKSIAERSGGDIYLGVVGAVRTGKSTFIKKFMEKMVIPNISDDNEKKRTIDELPQSAAGKTIMTTEPKFIPATAAKIQIDDFSANIRMIDCVGYVINSAKGYEDDNGPRYVMTPWYSEPIPFVEAAEIGTEKVIKEHSTIGIVITTDGSIGEFSRNDYIEAEETVISELKNIGKPFIVVLNSVHPMLPETENIANKLKEEHNVPVIPLNIENMQEKDMYDILKNALYEFPIEEVKVNIPEWVAILNPDHELKKEYINMIKESVIEVNKLKDIEKITQHFTNSDVIEKSYISEVNTSTGEVTINIESPSGLFNKVLSQTIGRDVSTKAQLLSMFQEYNIAKKEYDQIKGALKMVKQTGYGIASPTLADMKLDPPEIIKQGGRYGVKLKAKAPSIHITTIKMQWKYLIDGLMQEVGSHLNLYMKLKVI